MIIFHVSFKEVFWIVILLGFGVIYLVAFALDAFKKRRKQSA